jgi:hypothetical protein
MEYLRKLWKEKMFQLSCRERYKIEISQTKKHLNISPLTGTAEVIIQVKDVNDNCPYFTEEDQNFMYIWKELSKLTTSFDEIT